MKINDAISRQIIVYLLGCIIEVVDKPSDSSIDKEIINDLKKLFIMIQSGKIDNDTPYSSLKYLYGEMKHVFDEIFCYATTPDVKTKEDVVGLKNRCKTFNYYFLITPESQKTLIWRNSNENYKKPEVMQVVTKKFQIHYRMIVSLIEACFLKKIAQIPDLYKIFVFHLKQIWPDIK